MKPKIIMHTQISLDGRIKGFDNPEVYYQVAGGIHSDAVLFGSNTVFTAFEKYPAETEADFEKIITSPEDPRPIGVMAVTKLAALTLLGIPAPFFIDSYYQFAVGFLPSFWVAKAMQNEAVLYFSIGLVVALVWYYFLTKRLFQKLAG